MTQDEPFDQPTSIHSQRLPLRRCPYCGIARPLLNASGAAFGTKSERGTRLWRCFICTTCGGVVTARSMVGDQLIDRLFPSPRVLPPEVPDRPRDYLRQAQETLAQAVASIVVSASAVDSMLKAKGLSDGSLYDRIDKAAKKHLITDEMAKWAHQVRLDANDQRHADDSAPLPSQEDAERCLEFALALAEFLFVLPSRVTRGLKQAKTKADG